MKEVHILLSGIKVEAIHDNPPKTITEHKTTLRPCRCCTNVAIIIAGISTADKATKLTYTVPPKFDALSESP